MRRLIIHINHIQKDSTRRKVLPFQIKNIRKQNQEDIFLVAYLNLQSVGQDIIRYDVNLCKPWTMSETLQTPPSSENNSMGTIELWGLINTLKQDYTDITEIKIYLEANLSSPGLVDLTNEMLIHCKYISEDLGHDDTQLILFTETQKLLNKLPEITQKYDIEYSHKLLTSEIVGDMQLKQSKIFKFNEKEGYVSSAMTINTASSGSDSVYSDDSDESEKIDVLQKATPSYIKNEQPNKKISNRPFWCHFFLCQGISDEIKPITNDQVLCTPLKVS